MNKLPDYSEYLKKPGMLDFIEQQWKANPQIHDEHARVVNKAIKDYGIKKVSEIGCGTGEVARRLEKCIYVGYDISEDCIRLANDKNHSLMFTVADIRTLKVKYTVDLIFSFGVLKHFGLHEWFDIFKKMASLGKYFIFNMPIAKETKDDNYEFHHLWKSMEDLNQDIHNAGLEILDIDYSSKIEPIFICKRVES